MGQQEKTITVYVGTITSGNGGMTIAGVVGIMICEH